MSVLLKNWIDKIDNLNNNSKKSYLLFNLTIIMMDIAPDDYIILYKWIYLYYMIVVFLSRKKYKRKSKI